MKYFTLILSAIALGFGVAYIDIENPVHHLLIAIFFMQSAQYWSINK